MKKMLLQYDWDVIAGVLAAVVALVLHFLHIAESEVVLSIILVLLALLLLRDLRAESRSHGLAEELERVSALLLEVQQSLVPPDALLIGPQRLLQEFERYAVDAQGELTWYNVCCLMFKRQEVFDATLRMAIDNPHVTSIQLICDERVKDALANRSAAQSSTMCRSSQGARASVGKSARDDLIYFGRHRNQRSG